MPFMPDRLRSLRETKGFSQEDLAEVAGFGQPYITKIEKGKSAPTGDMLEKLACALDCTMDYLYGRGDHYDDAPTAAAHMAFDVFARSGSASGEQLERCRRALRHPDAPRTAKGWRSLAEIFELGLGPTPSGRTNLTVVKHRPNRSKQGVTARGHRA
ncbi:MAG TPA: helix-turn-helix transcriptional regulator [Terriglobales bacterium]|nr:helix-turn-helix transcriptional regulator [Terriglobales bacterium]